LLCFSRLLFFSQDVYVAVVLERASIDNTNSILLTDNTVIFEINKLGRAVTAHVLACHTSIIATSEPVTTALQIYTKLLCKESCLIGNMISGIFQQVSNEIGSHPESSPSHASSGAGAIPQKAVMSLLHDAAQLVQTVAEGISFLHSIHSASFGATDKQRLGVSSSSVSVAATLTGGAHALSPRHENGAALQYQYGYYYCTALFWHSCTEMLRLLCLLVSIENNKVRKEGMPCDMASELNRLRLRVFHCLHGSLPTTEELHCELRVLQFYRPDAHAVATEARLLEMLQQLHPFGSDIVPQYSLSFNNNDLLSDEKHLSFGTLRLRYIVFGAKSLFNVLQYMPCHTDALPTWSPPSTEKWVNQLAEAVLSMLNGGRVPNLFTPSGKLLVYGPYFVQLLSSLLSQLSVSSLSLPAIRWIFWDLAKVCVATLRCGTKVVVCP
jgi:hypothetical protein